ncbi:transducin beta-like protein 3 isoform X2 [Physella acuta]|uniref:transducin beta-like protein 3 isoform X1 n=1 Tax=Physella acuta TaxID=109671 RepID=UPI0027DC06E0|nr:transducin beta-like protein 3 isoform X1 [Physella acuta]XP_059142694.1 transducin beta-like protein 3 isoform X2 [Physella acuta]
MNRLKTSFAINEKYSAFYTGGQLQLSSDGTKLFCGCGKEVKIVDIKTGKITMSIGQDEDEEICQFLLSRDDEFLVLATRNQLFRQWRWRDKTLVKTWRSVHNAPVTCLAFDPTITLLASGCADHTIKVYDIVRGYFTHNFKGHRGVVRYVTFHPRAEQLHLVSAAEDYTVKVWDLKLSACIMSSECHTSLVTSIAFADNGATMYSAGKDKVVCIWKTDKWKVFKTIPVFQSVVSVIVPLEFPSLIDDDNTSRFITVCSNGEVRVINAESGKYEYTNTCRLSDSEDDSKSDSYITQALYSTDLNGIVLATYDDNIIQLSKDFTIEKQLCGHLDEILSLHFLGEDDSHVVAATNTDLLKVFNRDTWECQMMAGHSDIITSLDVKGNFIVSGSKDSSIRIWNLSADTGFVTCLGVGRGHTQAVQSVALARHSARPTYVLSGGVDMTLKVWSFPAETDITPMATLRVAATEHAHDKDINCLAVAPNDKLIASGSYDKTAKLWNIDDGLHSLTLLAVLRGHKRGIWCVKFSPVDQIVATSSGDGYIKLWSVSDYSCVRTFEGHDSSVLSILFLSSGRQLLSSGSDGLLKLWLIKTSECLKTFEGHDAKVWTIAATSQEDYVLSGGADSTVVLWKDVTQQEETEKQEQIQKHVMQEQVLSNLIADKKFVRAMGLAISLSKPYRALNILKEVLKLEDGEKQLERLICKLRMDQIESVLKFAVDWNTNSRNYYPAQQLINVVLRNFLPQELAKLPNIQSIVEGLTVYTDRHLQRLDNLLMESHFAEYCYSCMKTSV